MKTTTDTGSSEHGNDFAPQYSTRTRLFGPPKVPALPRELRTLKEVALVSRRLVLAAEASFSVRHRHRTSRSNIAWLAVQVDATIRWNSSSGWSTHLPATIQGWFPWLNEQTWPRLWQWLADHGVVRDARGFWTVERHTSLEYESVLPVFTPVPSSALTLERPNWFRLLVWLHRYAEDRRFDPNDPLARRGDDRKKILPLAGPLDFEKRISERALAGLVGMQVQTLRKTLVVLVEKKFYTRASQRLTPMDTKAGQDTPHKEQHKNPRARMETLWIEEFKRKFPELPIASEWDAKDRTLMKSLMGRYPEKAVTRAIRYYLRYWDAHQPRVLKGKAIVATFGQLYKMHDTFVPEANRFWSALKAREEYNAWCKEHPSATRAPDELQQAFDAARPLLKSLGL